MRSEKDGVCHNWGVGKGRICNTLGSCIQTWDDEFVQVLRGKTSSIKPVVVIKCLAYLLPIIVFLVRESAREMPWWRLDQASSNANDLLATSVRKMYAPTHPQLSRGVRTIHPPDGGQ